MSKKGIIKNRILVGCAIVGGGALIIGAVSFFVGIVCVAALSPENELLEKYDYESFNNQYKLEQVQELEETYIKDSPEYKDELNKIMNTDYNKSLFLKQTGDESYIKWEKDSSILWPIMITGGFLLAGGALLTVPVFVDISIDNKKTRKNIKEDIAVLEEVTYTNKPLNTEYQFNYENKQQK